MADKDSKKWTSFKTHVGVYEFEKMPFGLCNAGATFQRAMEKILRGFDNATAYIDDVMVFSKTFEEHLEHLEETFMRLRKASLKVKTRKCQFCRENTKFLGFQGSKEGIKVDEKGIETIKNYPTPKSAKEVKQFLGLASYYRKFINGFADSAEPLNKLTRTRIKFNWDKNAQEAFYKLKKALISPPILIFPNLEKPFRVICDASAFGIGAVLCQLDEVGNERVVSYASRTLNKAEHNYSTIERELLAIVWATKQYRVYLYGTQFELVTDHKPLTFLKSLGEGSARLARWRLALEELSYTITYKNGEANTNADALSRIERTEDKLISSVSEIVNLSPVTTKIDHEEIKKFQNDDESLTKLIKKVNDAEGKIKQFELKDGILYSNKGKKKSYENEPGKRLVVPAKLKTTVLTVCHDDMGERI